MKKTVNLLVTLTVLAGLGYVLFLGFQKREAAEAPEEDAAEHGDAAPEIKAESYVVTLAKAQVAMLGLTTVQPASLEFPATVSAWGTVLDPAPLAALDSDLASASAVLAASRAAHDRTLALAATNDASQQAAEATLAQFTSDRIKHEGLQRGARLQWGGAFLEDATARGVFTEQLVRGNAALIRVAVLPADDLTEVPRSVIFSVTGQESNPIKSTTISSAPGMDSKTQGRGYLITVTQPPFPLQPGMAVTASLSLPGPPRPGFAIPRSAILRHDGRLWIYLQEKEEADEIEYRRLAIPTGTPLAGEQGWFIPGVEGLTAATRIITTGAGTLLSEELKAQGGAPEID